MSDELPSTLEALEREEARLRERLAKIALVKDLLRELTGASPSQTQFKPEPPPPPEPQNAKESPTEEPPKTPPAYDGTFNGLISAYMDHERSPIHELKHSVRLNYERSFKRLRKDIGDEKVIDWNARTIQERYDEWAAHGDKIAMGHELVGKVRMLAGFGSTELNDDACIRLSTILGNMRFPVAKGDGAPRLTRDQARAIRIAAREQFGWNSIAFAVALLFDVPKLRQLDVIGEWVPLSDRNQSDIVKGAEKWIRGLMWSDLDENFVLHRTLPTGKGGRNEKRMEFRLSRSQMAMEEINRISPDKRKGPMIVCEFSGLPWSANEFRRKLKIVAERAGVSLRSQPDDSQGEAELEDEEAS
ncbi:hypothetical protein JQ625_24125 [Bradyrhizobium diazoefficiens]|nr:hypothetical protein [Bradyrhizobium diazoefficiens]MBR0777931.1 hypothetical protein [Bradyrhizobium diazoefficiens]